MEANRLSFHRYLARNWGKLAPVWLEWYYVMTRVTRIKCEPISGFLLNLAGFAAELYWSTVQYINKRSNADARVGDILNIF